MRLIDADALRAEWLWAIGEYTANEILDSIDDMPTVPQQMGAVEYLRAFDRLIKWCDERYCSSCEYENNCPFDVRGTPEQRVEPIQKWAQEHPEEVEDED